jgi:hypothetical protein
MVKLKGILLGLLSIILLEGVAFPTLASIDVQLGWDVSPLFFVIILSLLGVISVLLGISIALNNKPFKIVMISLCCSSFIVFLGLLAFTLFRYFILHNYEYLRILSMTETATGLKR